MSEAARARSARLDSQGPQAARMRFARREAGVSFVSAVSGENRLRATKHGSQVNPLLFQAGDEFGTLGIDLLLHFLK